MEDIICVGAEEMSNRSFNIVEKTLSQVLNIISNRLYNASDKELIHRSIILNTDKLPELGQKYSIRFLARDLSELLAPIGYKVELSHFKSDGITYFQTISISW